MCRGVEERERPLAAGRSFALGAPPPALVQLQVGGAGCRSWNVPEYLQEPDGAAFNTTHMLFQVILFQKKELITDIGDF